MDWCENFGGPQALKEATKARSLTIEQVDEEALLIHSQLSRWHKVGADWILKKFFRCLLAVATLEKMGFSTAQEKKATLLPVPPLASTSSSASTQNLQHRHQQQQQQQRQQKWTEASEVVHCFYCVCVPDVLSMLINEPLRRTGSGHDESPGTEIGLGTGNGTSTSTSNTAASSSSASNPSELLLYCLALLLDITKFVLQALGRGEHGRGPGGGPGGAAALASGPGGDGDEDERVGDAVAILTALSGALNRETLFHKQRKYEHLPFSILCHSHNCTKSALVLAEIPGASPAEARDKQQQQQVGGDCSSHSKRKKVVPRRENEQLIHCYRWITVLWESFGGNRIWNAKSFSGYDALLELLPRLHRYKLELNEAVLHFLCRALEFTQDEQMSSFVGPCFKYFMQIAKRICEEPVQMSSTGTVFLILEHMRYLCSIFGILLSRDMERCISEFVTKVQKKIRKEITAQQTLT